MFPHWPQQIYTYSMTWHLWIEGMHKHPKVCNLRFKICVNSQGNLQSKTDPFSSPSGVQSVAIRAYDLAPAAGPLLVKVGCRLSNIEAKDLEEVQTHIKDVLPSLDSRVIIEYTVLIASALQVHRFTHITWLYCSCTSY